MIIDSDNSPAAEEVTFIRQLTVQTMQLPILCRKCPCKTCDDNKSDANHISRHHDNLILPFCFGQSVCRYVSTMYSSGRQETVVPVLVITAAVTLATSRGGARGPS